jgi:hypothetical protein
VRCGACGYDTHTRVSATPENCPAYNEPKEVERREVQWRKKEERNLQKDLQKDQQILSLQQVKEHTDEINAEWLRQTRLNEQIAAEATRLAEDLKRQLEQSNAQAGTLMAAEIKRLQKSRQQSRDRQQKQKQKQKQQQHQPTPGEKDNTGRFPF